VEAITGGVRARVLGLLGAGEPGAFKLSTFTTSPSGFLIKMAALLRVGLVKAGDEIGLAFG
jgi:hypothetical protein